MQATLDCDVPQPGAPRAITRGRSSGTCALLCESIHNLNQLDTLRKVTDNLKEVAAIRHTLQTQSHAAHSSRYSFRCRSTRCSCCPSRAACWATCCCCCCICRSMDSMTPGCWCLAQRCSSCTHTSEGAPGGACTKQQGWQHSQSEYSTIAGGVYHHCSR